MLKVRVRVDISTLFFVVFEFPHIYVRFRV